MGSEGEGYSAGPRQGRHVPGGSQAQADPRRRARGRVPRRGAGPTASPEPVQARWTVECIQGWVASESRLGISGGRQRRRRCEGFCTHAMDWRPPSIG